MSVERQELAVLGLSDHEYESCMANALFAKVMSTVRLHLKTAADTQNEITKIRAEHVTATQAQGSHVEYLALTCFMRIVSRNDVL